MELEKLEAALETHPEVDQAAVAVHQDAFDTPLIAYVAASGSGGLTGGLSGGLSAELRRHLAETLPSATPPDLFVLVDRLPRAADGEVDRAALPTAGRGAMDGGAAPEITAGAAAVVADVWREILRVDRVDLRDDLYSLGGHSLSITRMAVQLRSQTGVEVPLTVFYDTPTVPGIAAALEELGAA